MARPTDQSLFLQALRAAGGRAPNGQLQSALDWNEDKYWRVHQQAFDAGLIERGRGYGGTVLLVEQPGVAAQDVAADADQTSIPIANEFAGELELYPPIHDQLSKHWAQRRQLDECHCETIAQQGRRDTGGSWSRPDLCVIGSRKFEYLPEKVFELHTFEVKNSNDVTIKGVLEALAHREAATRSYVLYHTGGREFSDYPESIRITELAGKHGIGLISAKEVGDIGCWDEIVPASRANADPEALNTFIGRSLSDDAKRKIRRWFSW